MAEGLGLTQCPIYKEKGDFTVTSPYGERIHPISGEISFHSGIDGVRGDHDIATIVSIDEGEVIDLDTSVSGRTSKKPKGNYVRIRHALGRESLYLHLAYESIPILTVYRGAKVKKGQTIGVMGDTGNSTGIHIHFQVYDFDGKTIIDPTPFLLGTNINSSEVDEMFVKVEPCKYKDTGEVVRNLQIKLCQQSEELEEEVKSHSLDQYGNLDGVFGKGLQKTLTKVQEMAGIPATGECDETTCAMLNDSLPELAGRMKTAVDILSP